MLRILSLVAIATALSTGVSAEASADPINENTTYYGANCTGLGEVTLAWLIFPTENARGGSSALQVVGTNDVVIIFTGATETLGMRDGTTCTFTTFNGSPIDPPQTFWVVIVPRDA